MEVLDQYNIHITYFNDFIIIYLLYLLLQYNLAFIQMDNVKFMNLIINNINFYINIYTTIYSLLFNLLIYCIISKININKFIL